jgi:phenylacetate-CoA ligase
MDRERLYAALPVSLQQAAICLEGRRIQRKRYNAVFHRLLDEYRARTFWSRDEIVAWRDRRIAAFVAHAAQTVPYYCDLFRDLGASPQDFKSLDDLKRLPILEKRTVQEQPERFLSEAARDWETITCHTSGTTGAGLRFTATADSQREHWALWWRYRSWHGLQLDEPCLYFGGRAIVPPRQQRPPFCRHNRPGRQWLFSGYHLSPEHAPAYIDAIRRAEARWIHGYPSLIALMSAYILQFGGNFEMRWVTLGAENVLPQQADLIERAFGVRPLSHYSMAEGVANISECPAGHHHVDEDFAAVEFLPLGDGPSCRILGTNLSNPAFPLLRYDTGDLAVPVEGECACGRPGRLVAAIDGRKEDVVVTKSGARLGRLDHLFKDMVHIREAQIRQTRPGHIELRVVRGPEYAEADERRLREETRKRTGTDLDFDIVYLDALPRMASGKLRFVVSEIKPETGGA